MIPSHRRYLIWFMIVVVIVFPTTRTSPGQVTAQQQQQQQHKRIIHTYFDDSNTSDHFDNDTLLLEYWQQSWQAAGWETRVLNVSHLTQGSTTVSWLLPQQHHSLHKYMAMTTSGGFYCHWDVFPLNNHPPSFPTLDTLYSDRLLVYEVIAPTCMSGSKFAWQQLLQVLKEHAHKEKDKFWTDGLALVDVRDHPILSFQRRVLQLDDSYMFPVVESSFDKHHPCHHIQKQVQDKHKWAVQISAATLQRIRSLPKEWQYPEYQFHFVRSWFQNYHQQCKNGIS